jgi:hypothetical protein
MAEAPHLDARREDFISRISNLGVLVSALGRVDEHAMPASAHLDSHIRHVLPDAGGVGHERLADDKQSVLRR